MNVLVTGANGFLGKNLITFLLNEKNIDIQTFDRDNSLEEIEKNINNIDFIFHLAGVNRPENEEEYYKGNTDLTKSLIDLLNKYNKKIPLVFSSSIQAELNNAYGQSKKQAEDYILNNYDNGIIFRLHNVFGKWCKPNYNSVVATFCYNIANDKEITITDPKREIELVYIDDVCKRMIKIISTKLPKNKYYYYVSPRKKITLGKLAKLIKSFKENMNSIYVPKTGDEFIKKLFATYVSYVPINKMEKTALVNTDQRGSFTELVKTIDSGQFSFSVSKPGIIRGNHYHNTKMERFIVIKGTAKIKFKKIIEDEEYEFIVDDKQIKIITIPPGYTHNIENIGTDEMILFIWCNELFDANNPDTYYMEIK